MAFPSRDAIPASGVWSATREVVSLRAEVTALRAELDALRRARDRDRQHLAIDPPTGLLGRLHFDARLDYEWRRALRFWTPLSLVVIDLGDAQRLIEERGRGAYGHTLRALAELVETHRRDVDIAGRVASNSFAVLLPGTGRLGAEAELSRLEAALAPRADALAITLGFGMAVAFDDAETSLELLMAADADALGARSGVSPEERRETIPVGAPSRPPAEADPRAGAAPIASRRDGAVRDLSVRVG